MINLLTDKITELAVWWLKIICTKRKIEALDIIFPNSKFDILEKKYFYSYFYLSDLDPDKTELNILKDVNYYLKTGSFHDYFKNLEQWAHCLSTAIEWTERSWQWELIAEINNIFRFLNLKSEKNFEINKDSEIYIVYRKRIKTKKVESKIYAAFLNFKDAVDFLKHTFSNDLREYLIGLDIVSGDLYWSIPNINCEMNKKQFLDEWGNVNQSVTSLGENNVKAFTASNAEKFYDAFNNLDCEYEYFEIGKNLVDENSNKKIKFDSFTWFDLYKKLQFSKYECEYLKNILNENDIDFKDNVLKTISKLSGQECYILVSHIDELEALSNFDLLPVWDN